MKNTGTSVLIATSWNSRNYLALVFLVGSGKEARPLPGRGPNRESAIADALGRRQIFYADESVERDVLRAEAHCQKVQLILVRDMLHRPQLAPDNFAIAQEST